MDRESFWISDAAHLDFDTESFDAVVSNFVFHEVHSAKEGISEIHYIGDLEKKLDFIPNYARTPWMISEMGILYGRK